MRLKGISSKKWLEKSLRGSKENFLKRVILDRRRYNKAVGVYYLRRSYYIFDDLIYFRQFKRTLESFFRVSQSLLHTFSPTGAFLRKKKKSPRSNRVPVGEKEYKKF